MDSLADLKASLLIRTEDEVSRSEWLPLPVTRIEVQDSGGLLGKQWVTRKDPAAPTPWAKGVLAQPPPDRRTGDFSYQTPVDHFAAQLGTTEARDRHPRFRRQSASQCLDLNDEIWGGKWEVVLPAARRPSPSDASRRSAFATCSRWAVAGPRSRRSACSTVPPQRGESAWPGRHPYTVTYTVSSSAPARIAPRRSTRSQKGSFLALRKPPSGGSPKRCPSPLYVIVLANTCTSSPQALGCSGARKRPSDPALRISL